MSRRGSSGRWLEEHRHDPYVKKARVEGRIARSAYKLVEIDKRDKLLRPGATVIDLGAAPGGWSEYAGECVGAKGQVFALDRLEMMPLKRVQFIQGDFSEQSVLDELTTCLGDQRPHVVLSDLAPNFSGLRQVDQARCMELAELATEFALEHLDKEGAFLVKVFHGEGFDPFVKDLRARFQRVATRKPDASRSRSRETYILARGLKE
ncbi:MAG: 23S rRNA methyltransferase [Chromatiales bacterium]|jgi:23S rRNA (uridine2552-2'-O)-methyltransferase|nr:23S rRNA methyltransferase [Chromatiales bacterium]